MKIRTGFVSNSSSTSFECSICGYSESYFDSVSEREFGVISCENGHILCEKHILEYFPNINIFVNSEWEDENGYLKEECCPFCQMIEFDNISLRRYLKRKYEITEEEVFAYVKTVNKRRRVLKDEEYVEYVLRKVETDIVHLEEQIKAEFKTFVEFWRWSTNRKEEIEEYEKEIAASEEEMDEDDD